MSKQNGYVNRYYTYISITVNYKVRLSSLDILNVEDGVRQLN